LAPAVRRVVLPHAAARLLQESFPTDRPRPDVEVVGVQTLDELLALLWPDVFASAPVDADPNDEMSANR
jgi:hypothetical protein